MAVAVFCLQQAGQAIAVVAPPEGASLDDPESMPEFDQIESHVLHLQHVYKSCCILNGNWPSVFPRAARSTANTFIRRWKASAGGDLRAAFTHFEEALADPDHRLRGDPRSTLRMRGTDIPFFGAEYHRVGTPQDVLARIHRSKLEGAGCRAAGAFGGRAGVRRAVPERGAVAQDRSGALRARARGCARRARACWREPRTRVGAVSERQAGSGSARNRARAAAHWPAQGQRFARCRVQRRAEWVSRPASAK